MANRFFGRDGGIEVHPHTAQTSYAPVSQPTGDTKNPYVLDSESFLPDTHVHHHHRPGRLVRLNSNFGRTIRSLSWFVHILALGCTAAAIQFSFSEFYWADEDDWGNVQFMKFLKGQQTQDALQFAAKLHEIIIQASLSAMVLHFMRRMLIGKGMPWGLMSGSYQVGAPPWLFSAELWANFFKPGNKRTWAYAFGLMMLCFYSNTIGPFSAIVLSPMLEWWPVHDPFGGKALPGYLGTSFEGVFPQLINEIILGQDDAPVCVQYGEQYCPDGGTDDVKAVIDSYFYNRGRPEGEIRQQGVDVSRGLVASNKYGTDTEAMSIATTLQASVSELTAGFWNYINGTNVGRVNTVGRPKLVPMEDNIFAPVVQVQCTHFQYSEIVSGGDRPRWQTSRLRNFSSYRADQPETDWYREKDDWDVPADFTNEFGDEINLEQFWNEDRESLAMESFTWVDAARIFEDERPSLAALITVPILQDEEGALVQDSLIVPCMIDAHWAGVKTEYDPMADKLLPNNLTNIAGFETYWEAEPPTYDKLNSRKTIIESHWANYLNNQVFNETNESEITDITYTGPAMEWLLQPFIKFLRTEEGDEFWDFRTATYDDGSGIGDRRQDAAEAISNVVALALVEGMSRASHRSSYGLVMEDLGNGHTNTMDLYLQSSEGTTRELEEVDTEMVDAWFKIQWKVERKGWGYGLRTPTVKAGIAVLLVHAGLVVIYTVYVFFFRVGAKGWHLSAWGGFGELIALGLASRKPENRELLGKLVSASDNWSTQTTKVAVRSVDGQTLELVIGNDIHGQRLMREKAYSWL